jgi:hypothetical protein
MGDDFGRMVIFGIHFPVSVEPEDIRVIEVDKLLRLGHDIVALIIIVH